MTDELNYTPPKYLRIASELRRRIREGVYKPGEMLPSESQLVREFGFGRTTVVRALQMLQRDGWIEREHGMGSYAKKPPTDQASSARPGRTVLEQPETSADFQLIHAGEKPIPGWVASLLQLADDSPAVLRQWTVSHEGESSELVSCWVPLRIAEGTVLGDSSPLQNGVRQHLQAVKSLRFDHVTERLAARPATGREAELLEIQQGAAVLAVVATIFDASDRPLLAIDLVLRGDLHELEDSYSLS